MIMFLEVGVEWSTIIWRVVNAALIVFGGVKDLPGFVTRTGGMGVWIGDRRPMLQSL